MCSSDPDVCNFRACGQQHGDSVGNMRAPDHCYTAAKRLEALIGNNVDFYCNSESGY